MRADQRTERLGRFTEVVRGLVPWEIHGESGRLTRMPTDDDPFASLSSPSMLSAITDLIRDLSDAELHELADTVRQVQTERAVGSGDHDAIIAAAFEVAFGRDGLGVLPWIEGNLIVCPGSMVSKSRANHRCRFVSVDNEWVWESALLLREDKRSSPGSADGFRAVALLPLVDGTALDVVSGRARSGQHSVEHVVSYEVRGGELVEVGQRSVNPRH